MPRKKKDRNYYGVDQEAAVVLFLNAKNHAEKEKIYRTYLQEPINKMIESIIRKYKLYRPFHDFNYLHSDTLSFLITKFDKFDPEKGNKSYSYYGTVCKNYLYNEMMKDYRKNIVGVTIETPDDDILMRDELLYEMDSDHVDLVLFMETLIKNLKSEIIKCGDGLSDNEFRVGHALINILENWRELFSEIDKKNATKFNKNLVLLYIRNLTGLSTKEIRNGMKRYKVLYQIFKHEFMET